MTSYVLQVLECPACQAHFVSMSVASHNTFDAIWYTDGFIEGPMFDEGCPILECPECRQCFWCESVRTLRFVQEAEYSRDAECKTLPWANRDLRFASLVDDGHWETEAQERYIRTRAWWESNHSYRREQSVPFNLAGNELANLEKLLLLLAPNDSRDALTAAEISRELGRLDECLRRLDRDFDEHLRSAASQVRQLARDGSRRVARLVDVGS